MNTTSGCPSPFLSTSGIQQTICPTRSIRPTFLLTIFSLLLPLLSSIYDSSPPAIRTLFQNRRCIRTTIVSQRFHFVVYIILIFARGVVSLARSAVGDLPPRMATLDVKDEVPCTHLCVGEDSSRAAFPISSSKCWLMAGRRLVDGSFLIRVSSSGIVVWCDCYGEEVP